MGQTALLLHMCIGEDGNVDRECARPALETCDPPSMTDDECIAGALAEIAAFEEQASSPPPEPQRGLAPGALVAIAAATVAFFGAVAWRVSTRTRRRNTSAFSLELPDLGRRGYRRIDPPQVMTFAAVGNHRIVRAMTDEGTPPILLLELELPGGAMNEQWPLRAAVLPTPPGVPPGSVVPDPSTPTRFNCSFASPAGDGLSELLIGLLAEHHPHAGAETNGTHILVYGVAPAKVLGKKVPPALRLFELATLAEQLRLRFADGAGAGPATLP